MGLILRRNGLNVRVDGLQRRGASGDSCCCGTDIGCTCSEDNGGVYEVTTNVDSNFVPTDGTRFVINSITAPVVNSTLQCAVTQIEAKAITRTHGHQTYANDNALVYGEDQFTAVTICSRRIQTYIGEILCNSIFSANFRLFSNPDGTNLTIIMDSGAEIFGTCCDFTVSGPGTVSANGITPESTTVTISVSVVAGPC